MTYVEQSMCVMVPLPKVISIMEFAFLKPFDFMTWLLFILSLLVAMFLWKFLKKESNSSTQWRFIFEILAVLVGQSISIRHKRLMMTILLQIFIFSAFYLRNLYEGIVTSVMTERFVEKRFSTFDELIESDENFKFQASDYFVSHMMNTSHYERIKDWLTFSVNSSLQDLSKNRTVIITSCSVIDHYMSGSHGKNSASQFYYVLPEKLFPHYLHFDVGFFSPYIDKLQELMDRAFEAGLPQAWKKLHNQFIYTVLSENPKMSGNDEPKPLEFMDLYQIFMILPIGYALAFIAYLFEFVYHKYQHVSWTWVKIVVMRKLRMRNTRVAPFRPA